MSIVPFPCRLMNVIIMECLYMYIVYYASKSVESLVIYHIIKNLVSLLISCKKDFIKCYVMFIMYY